MWQLAQAAGVSQALKMPLLSYFWLSWCGSAKLWQHYV